MHLREARPRGPRLRSRLRLPVVCAACVFRVIAADTLFAPRHRATLLLPSTTTLLYTATPLDNHYRPTIISHCSLKHALRHRSTSLSPCFLQRIVALEYRWFAISSFTSHCCVRAEGKECVNGGLARSEPRRPTLMVMSVSVSKAMGLSREQGASPGLSVAQRLGLEPPPSTHRGTTRQLFSPGMTEDRP
ncbi:hypothetical protein J6590_034557 [Homalodisca vitripennis]|nr:hypothetical protein J6590_034557 [Homalodisca vitripennis]